MATTITKMVHLTQMDAQDLPAATGVQATSAEVARSRRTWRAGPGYLTPGDWALFCALAAWVFLVRAPLFYCTLGQDEGLYLAIADGMLRGARLYGDLWDNKPVGIFLIYGAIIELFGASTAAVRVGSAAAVLATSALLFWIGFLAFGEKRVGWVAAFTFPAFMLDLGADGANAETFMACVQSAAVLLVVRASAKHEALHVPERVSLAFGILQGLLLQIKFSSLLETGAIYGFLALSSLFYERSIGVALRRAVAFLAGYVAPTVLVFSYFTISGRLDEMVFSNFVSPRLYVETPFGLGNVGRAVELTARRLSYFAPLIVAGLIYVAGPLRKEVPAVRVRVGLVLAWFVGSVLAATSSGYFRYFHFIVCAPSLVVLASVALSRFVPQRSPWVRAGSLLGVAVLAAYPLVSYASKLPRWMYSDEYRMMAETAGLARTLVPAGSLVFYADLNPALYTLTRTEPATRYPQAIAHVFDLPSKFGVDPVAELNRTFRRRPALVIGSPERIGPGSRYADTIQPWLSAGYERVAPADPWLADRIVVFRLVQP